MSDHHSIGQVARRFRLSLRTLYHYEDLELVVPLRSEGRRLYDAGCVERLERVLEQKRAGRSLAAIALALGSQNGDRPLQGAEFSPGRPVRDRVAGQA